MHNLTPLLFPLSLSLALSLATINHMVGTYGEKALDALRGVR